MVAINQSINQSINGRSCYNVYVVQRLNCSLSFCLSLSAVHSQLLVMLCYEIIVWCSVGS